MIDMVPVDEIGEPLTGIFRIAKPLGGAPGVFESLKQRFAKCIVVAHPGRVQDGKLPSAKSSARIVTPFIPLLLSEILTHTADVMLGVNVTKKLMGVWF